MKRKPLFFKREVSTSVAHELVSCGLNHVSLAWSQVAHGSQILKACDTDWTRAQKHVGRVGNKERSKLFMSDSSGMTSLAKAFSAQHVVAELFSVDGGAQDRGGWQAWVESCAQRIKA